MNKWRIGIKKVQDLKAKHTRKSTSYYGGNEGRKKEEAEGGPTFKLASNIETSTDLKKEFH